MSERCEAPHPEDPAKICSKTKPCRGEHWSIRGDSYWPGNPVPQKGSNPTRVKRIAEKARDNSRT